jgi:hypothetical protein
MATVERWGRVYVELQRRSEKLGYNPPGIVGSKFLAFRDSSATTSSSAFVVVRDGRNYFLQRPDNQPPLPLTHVNSIESLSLLLKSLKQPTTRR